mgnify:CR=1 FL=1
MLALAVGVAIERLRALSALGQVVAVLAAVEAPEDGDPEGLLVPGLLLLRAFLGGGFVGVGGSGAVLHGWVRADDEELRLDPTASNLRVEIFRLPPKVVTSF